MNVVCRAILFGASVTIAALSQTATFGDVSYDAAGTLNHSGPATPDIGIAGGGITAAFQGFKPAACSSYNNFFSTTLLLPTNPCYAGRDASARFQIFQPFSYATTNNRPDYFPIKLGPLRYTVWSRVSQSEKPATGRLQNLVDGILRHYTSDPVVPLNRKCLRALSCNSLYQQRLQRRSVRASY